MNAKRYLTRFISTRRQTSRKGFLSSICPQLQFRLLQTLLLGLLVTLLVGLPVHSQPASPIPSPIPSPTPAPAAPLRVATRLTEPDAFEQNGQIVGFSVDLGRSVLEQFQRPAVVQTYPDVAGVLEAIRSGQADLGIAAIALTSQREQEFDFSHPILADGLQILTLARDAPNEIHRILSTLFSRSVLNLLGLTALLMLIPVHLVWYFERHNPELISNPAYFPGIFEALWWTLLTLVGQAEDMPKAAVGRIVALFWVLVGIIFVTYFTAIITADLTIQELRSDIQTLNDLENRPVALVADTAALDYLRRQNIEQVETFTDPEQAYAALESRTVDAIVAPRLLLLHMAAQKGRNQVQIVGTPFRNQFYSIAMPKDSPYRRPINQALISLKEQGLYSQIYRKWYGDSGQD